MSEPRTTAPMWSAAPPVNEAATLEELSLLLGALKPEAVCRIAREVARALARVHAQQPGADGALTASRIVIDVSGHVVLSPLLDATGGLLRVDEPRLVPPERRGTAYVAEPGDDLYALGVLAAEAALGHPLEAPTGYLDMRVLDGAIPGRLLDAIAALVAPPERRLTNAAAALRVFADIEPRFGDGGRALSKIVEHARLGAAFGGLGATLDDGEDAEGPITIPDPLPLAQLTPPDPLATGPFRKHEIGFFARGIIIAPAPVPTPTRRAKGATWRAAGLGVTVGLVAVAAFMMVQWPETLTRARALLPSAPAVLAAEDDALEIIVAAPAPRAAAVPVVAVATQAVVAAATPAVVAEATQAVVEKAVVAPSVAAEPIAAEPIAAEPIAAIPAPAAESAAVDVVIEEAVASSSAASTAPSSATASAERAIAPVVTPKKPLVKKPVAKATQKVAVTPAPAKATQDEAALGAELAEGPSVKLIVDGAPAARARAEAALRACAIDGPILGALEVKGRKVVRVTSDPSNLCVERVLKRTLGGYAEDQPFEIELR